MRSEQSLQSLWFQDKESKGIVKDKRVFDCAPHAVDLQKAFGIDITNDLQMSLPNTFCRPCYQSMEHAVKAIHMEKWPIHRRSSCIFISN